MNHLRIFFFLCVLAFSANAQLHIDSLSHIDYQILHGANLNDVWGYVDELGNEYAIVGTSKGTSIVNITNGAAPQEVFWLPGSESIWRDPCVFGNYAYITTEAEDGLLIIDLNPLPQSNNLPTAVYTGPVGSSWQSAHTCYTSPTGYAYIFGSNRGNGGVIILDLNPNPMAPIEVGSYDPYYVHDGFERNDTLYTAHIFDGFFSLIDVSDKSNPQVIATHSSPNSFTHNIWPSASGAQVFTTDEISGAYIAAYDISNPAQITELDRVQSTQGTHVIPHNVHVKGNFLITSYYSDGIVIHDASYPNNLVKVGFYDTYPGQTPGYDGCWGVYPFYPSNKAVAADITKGLFILQMHYNQAAYINGHVSDLATGALLENVQVSVSGAVMTEQTNNAGFYASGLADAQLVSVTFNKAGYYPLTLTANLSNGQVTTLDAHLLAIPPYSFNVHVTESQSGNPISNAQIRLSHPMITHTGLTNGLGDESLTLYYQDSYELTVGKWSYQSVCTTLVITASTQDITIELPKGYYDDFEFDFGWSVIGNAATGMWERGVPFPTTNTVTSPDADWDCGKQAMLTGNAPAVNPDVDDVDNGFTTLISPIFDLAGLTTPVLNYARSFYCYHGPGLFNDSLIISLSNGLQTIVIDQVGAPQGNLMSFNYVSIPLTGLLPFTNTMQLFIRIADDAANPNITEGGFDHFVLTNEPIAALSQSQQTSTFQLVPNPGSQSFRVAGIQNEAQLSIYSATGALVGTQTITPLQTDISTSDWPEGLYFIEIDTQVLRWVKIAQ